MEFNGIGLSSSEFVSGKLGALAESTADNIHLLKAIIPDLKIDKDELLLKLKNRNITKSVLREIIASVRHSIDLWERTMGEHPCNLEAETADSRAYGYKHARQIEMGNFLKEIGLAKVKMPLLQGISDPFIHSFLNEQAPKISVEWKELDHLFRQCSDKRDFLDQPEVREKLTSIDEAIKRAFAFPNLIEFPDEVNIWLEEIKASEDYIMVRSSGAEDSGQTANAGGNKSPPYVVPEKEDLFKAIGEVICSYYGYSSLKNRINGGDNPFSRPNMSSVSLSQLIGEPIGGVSTTEEIPASVVLFSNEPIYVDQEEFRVMRVSATWGHGEGVVGTVGIKSDTILILRSVKYPDRLYMLENTSMKPRRLAPMQDPQSGKISLERVPNPSSLANSPTLSPEMLTRLFYLGIAIEKKYGSHPVDMELVIKNGVIYPVQVRPVNRPKTLPNYLDWRKVNHTSSLKRVSTTMFLSGKAEVLTGLTQDQILISDTLKNAEKKFKDGQHRLVIVSIPEESTNSHPIVNFSGMGIPCFHSENISDVRELFSEATTVVACTQTGDLVVLENPESCISKGYAVHPAKIAVSIVPYSVPRIPSSNEKVEIPQEIKRLLNRVVADRANGEALDALRQLRFMTKSTVTRRVAATVTLVDKLLDSAYRIDTAFTRAIDECKATIKTQPDQRLHRLLHLKVIETICLSVVNVSKYLEEAKRISDYQSKFGGNTQFHEEIILGDFMMTESQKDLWNDFIISLEQNRNLPQPKIEQFKQLLDTLQRFNLLPLWMARFFLPTYLSKGKDSIACLEELIQLLSPEAEPVLSWVAQVQSEIDELDQNLDLFSSALFEQLDTKIDDSKIRLIFDCSNPILKIYAIHMMSAAVSVYDKAIKNLKGNSEMSEAMKIGEFHKMLEGYFILLKSWVEDLSAAYLLTHRQSANEYLKQLEECLKVSSNGSETLLPSPAFNVSAALLGGATDFSRALPKTKEDIFTLIHQNLIFSLQVLLGNEMKNKTVLPEFVLESSFRLESAGFHLCAYQFFMGKFVLTYNLPLRNHSMMVELHFEKKTQKCTLHAKFLGQARRRWEGIGFIATLLDKLGIWTLVVEPKIEPMMLEYAIRLDNSDMLEFAVNELGHHASWTLDGRLDINGPEGRISSLLPRLKTKTEGVSSFLDASVALSKAGSVLDSFKFLNNSIILFHRNIMSGDPLILELHFNQVYQQTMLQVKISEDKKFLWNGLSRTAIVIYELGWSPCETDKSHSIASFTRQTQPNEMEFYQSFVEKQPTEDTCETANLYGALILLNILKGDKKNRDQYLTLLFTSPYFINVFANLVFMNKGAITDDLFDLLKDERELNPDLRPLMVAYLDNCRDTPKEKLACLIMRCFLKMGTNKIDQTLEEMKSFTLEIPLPIRWFLYDRLISAGVAVPDIDRELKALATDHYYLAIWRSLESWSSKILESINQTLFSDLPALIKTVNLSDSNGGKILHSLYKRIESIPALSADDFLHVRSIYLDAMERKRITEGGALALACARKGYAEALEDAFKVFKLVTAPVQKIFVAEARKMHGELPPSIDQQIDEAGF